jgi:cell division protein ZapA
MTVEQPRQPPGHAMSQVTVTINGRQFRMACEDGQEAHLRQLATDLDDRIAKLRRNFGEIGDTRLTVMAALTLADELSEMGDRLRAVEQELAALHDARVASADRAVMTQAAVAAALDAAAERIESITQRLNETRGAPEVEQDVPQAATEDRQGAPEDANESSAT